MHSMFKLVSIVIVSTYEDAGNWKLKSIDVQVMVTDGLQLQLGLKWGGRANLTVIITKDKWLRKGAEIGLGSSELGGRVKTVIFRVILSLSPIVNSWTGKLY